MNAVQSPFVAIILLLIVCMRVKNATMHAQRDSSKCKMFLFVTCTVRTVHVPFLYAEYPADVHVHPKLVCVCVCVLHTYMCM